MARSWVIFRAVLFGALTSVLLPACDEPTEQEASDTDASNDGSSHDHDEQSTDGSDDQSRDEDASTVAGPRPDSGARADASASGTSEQGPFDGTIIAAAMDGTVGGGKGPFWLYRGGVAPIDEEGLLPIPASALTHHAANPDLWVKWRRTTEGRVERHIKGQWQPLDYDDEYAALAKGTTFGGTFESSAVAGGIAAITRTYRFAQNGRYDFCEAIVGGPRILYTRSSGTYEVDGYVIRMVVNDGTRTALSFIYDPVQRPNSMWINRGSFRRDNGANPTGPLDC